jgi:hypothetical protein
MKGMENADSNVPKLIYLKRLKNLVTFCTFQGERKGTSKITGGMTKGFWPLWGGGGVIVRHTF